MLLATSTRRISLEIAGETVTLICRVPSGDELSKFLNSRFETRRNKVNARLYEARGEFFNKIAIDIENAEYEGMDGKPKPLSAATQLTDEEKTKYSGLLGVRVDTWKDLIAVNVKSSFMQRFEDSADAEDAQTKN